jgi:hypothetical protein
MKANFFFVENQDLPYCIVKEMTQLFPHSPSRDSQLDDTRWQHPVEMPAVPSPSSPEKKNTEKRDTIHFHLKKNRWSVIFLLRRDNQHKRSINKTQGKKNGIQMLDEKPFAGNSFSSRSNELIYRYATISGQLLFLSAVNIKRAAQF